MGIFEIIKQVDNGSLHTTKDIYPLEVKNSSDTPRQHNAKEIKAFEKYCALMDCIGEKQITGDKEIIGDKTYYSNLRLTKDGENLLRFSKLTIDDIDNSSGKDSIKVWLFRPVIVAIITAIITIPISIIFGVYIGKQLNKPETPQQNIQQNKQKVPSIHLPETEKVTNQ